MTEPDDISEDEPNHWAQKVEDLQRDKRVTRLEDWATRQDISPSLRTLLADELEARKKDREELELLKTDHTRARAERNREHEKVGQLEAEIRRLSGMLAELQGKINTPQTANFVDGILLEAMHQRKRWGSEHDHGKEPSDWFWLIGYLGGKALSYAIHGDKEKALHHTISTAAVLMNWHAALSGVPTRFRPGIEPPSDAEDEPEQCPDCGYTEADKATHGDHHLCPSERGIEAP